MGLALIFAPFQNCTLSESPDRKELNEKGFPSVSACMPYLDSEEAAQIMGASAKVGFLPPTSGPVTCSVVTDGAGTTGLGSFRCSISASNVDRAKNPASDLTLLTPTPSPDFYHYSYSRQDTDDNKTYVFSVGAVEGRTEGISCWASFDPAPDSATEARAVEIGSQLVEIMANRAP